MNNMYIIKTSLRNVYKCICFEAQVSLGPLISSQGPEIQEATGVAMC